MIYYTPEGANCKMTNVLLSFAELLYYNSYTYKSICTELSSSTMWIPGNQTRKN